MDNLCVNSLGENPIITELFDLYTDHQNRIELMTSIIEKYGIFIHGIL